MRMGFPLGWQLQFHCEVGLFVLCFTTPALCSPSMSNFAVHALDALGLVNNKLSFPSKFPDREYWKATWNHNKNCKRCSNIGLERGETPGRSLPGPGISSIIIHRLSPAQNTPEQVIPLLYLWSLGKGQWVQWFCTHYLICYKVYFFFQCDLL